MENKVTKKNLYLLRCILMNGGLAKFEILLSPSTSLFVLCLYQTSVELEYPMKMFQQQLISPTPPQ